MRPKETFNTYKSAQMLNTHKSAQIQDRKYVTKHGQRHKVILNSFQMRGLNGILSSANYERRTKFEICQVLTRSFPGPYQVLIRSSSGPYQGLQLLSQGKARNSHSIERGGARDV